jgi:hypothetical protein
MNRSATGLEVCRQGNHGGLRRFLFSRGLAEAVPEPQVPAEPKERRKNYLMFEQTPDKRFTFGSDAITNSYTKWGKPRALVEAKAELSEEQKRRYFNPPYTIGSAMIWPVRKIHRPTLNTARGMRLRIADRMDLTLEGIWRHYAEEPGSPLADVTTNYADFFKLFCTFTQFVEFFHLQDLVAPEGKIDFFLDEDENFRRPGVPTTKDEYVKAREASLKFITLRGNRMADWVEENHPDVKVRRQYTTFTPAPDDIVRKRRLILRTLRRSP